MARIYNTARAKKRFLNHFEANGYFYAAVAAAGRTRQTIYNWIDSDPEFALEFKTAKEIFVEKLEQEADRRAMKGVARPVFFHGQLVMDAEGQPVTVQEYSDALLMFRLKALDPAHYREKYSADLT